MEQRRQVRLVHQLAIYSQALLQFLIALVRQQLAVEAGTEARVVDGQVANQVAERGGVVGVD